MASMIPPYLNSSEPLVYSTGAPTPSFHYWWQLIVDALKATVGVTSLTIDGGNASNSGTPYFAIDGGSA